MSLQGQDRGGFEHVFDENVERVYGFFGYRLGSRLDAEDLTQHTFERALRAWDRFDPTRASAQTWLLAIARNLLIDHYRQDRSASERPLEGNAEAEAALGATPSPEESIGLDPRLEAALQGLGDRPRELLALRFGGELSGSEIAELTGQSLANVQQILSRTLRSLRAELDRGQPSNDTHAPNGPAPAIPSATAARSRPPEPA
jgi:RNA polymerase sigma-70 factor (ECF subfamily)